MNVDQSITNINTKEDDANNITNEEIEYDDFEEIKEPRTNGGQNNKSQF